MIEIALCMALVALLSLSRDAADPSVQMSLTVTAGKPAYSGLANDLVR